MIKKMKSKEYALGVERMDKEVGAPIDIAQSPMLMAAYEAGRERAPCRRVYVYGQDGEHDGYRYLYIKGRG